jgi:hypothetical protein
MDADAYLARTGLGLGKLDHLERLGSPIFDDTYNLHTPLQLLWPEPTLIAPPPAKFGALPIGAW